MKNNNNGSKYQDPSTLFDIKNDFYSLAPKFALQRYDLKGKRNNHSFSNAGAIEIWNENQNNLLPYRYTAFSEPNEKLGYLGHSEPRLLAKALHKIYQDLPPHDNYDPYTKLRSHNDLEILPSIKQYQKEHADYVNKNKINAKILSEREFCTDYGKGGCKQLTSSIFPNGYFGHTVNYTNPMSKQQGTEDVQHAIRLLGEAYNNYLNTKSQNNLSNNNFPFKVQNLNNPLPQYITNNNFIAPNPINPLPNTIRPINVPYLSTITENDINYRMNDLNQIDLKDPKKFKDHFGDIDYYTVPRPPSDDNN